MLSENMFSRNFKLLLIILAFFVIWLLSSTDALAISEDYCLVPVAGELCYDDAFEALSYVNEQRESLGLNKLVMDQTLLNYAMLRAAEQVISFDHVRPDGSVYNSGCELVYSENCAAGYSEAWYVVYIGWRNSPNHYSNMINEKWVSTGIGCIEVDGFERYWVQVFGCHVENEVSLSDYLSSEYVTTTITVLDNLAKESIEPILSTNGLNPGDKASLSIECNSYYTVNLPVEGLEFSSSNENVCTISEDGTVSAIAPGEVEIYLWYKGLEESPWTFSLCVHKWNDGVTVTPSTCVVNGEMMYTCIICQSTYTESTPTSEHKYNDGVHFNATCIFPETIEFTCTECGAWCVEELSPPTYEHTYDEGVVVLEPTCDYGKIRYSCTGCSTYYTQVIEPIYEHSWEEVMIKREPTCSSYGEIINKCVQCGKEVTIKSHTEHGSWIEDGVNASGNVVYRCLTCGVNANVIWSEFSTCECHALVEYDCVICDEPHIEEVFVSDHQWNEGQVTKVPTKTTEGERTYTCSGCGETKTEVIPMLVGDISGDDQVTALDMVLMMKHIVGDPDTDITEEEADFNNDGQTDILDVIRLMRYLAGHDVALS